MLGGYERIVPYTTNQPLEGGDNTNQNRDSRIAVNGLIIDRGTSFVIARPRFRT